MSHRFPSADDAADPRAFGEMEPPPEPTCWQCGHFECRCCPYCVGTGEVIDTAMFEDGPGEITVRCHSCLGSGVL